uniref:aspartate transaminase n=1 Tax=Amphora coffeiformis TaxID=265554 RepID=A0A7S3KZ81_9STRA
MTLLEESPPDPPGHRTNHSASVRLSGGWKELGETVMQAAAAALAEQNSDTGEPPAVVAFFPLPDEPADAAPPSPRALHRAVPADAIPMVELTLPTVEDNIKEKRHMQHTPSAIASEEASDAAKVDMNELLEDTDFSSVGTVASKEFSEGMADEIWEDVPMGPTDAILGIAAAFKASTDERKVNVCVGAYRDEHGKPWVLPSVKQAEKIMWENATEVKEYLPIEGDAEFVRLAMQFAYGPEMPMDHLAAVQTLSGTGACRLGGEFLAQFWPNHPIYLPDPTWGNHINIFQNCGLDVRRYRYFSRATNGLDLRGMMRDLHRAPDQSIILLHACAHNPTGCDPTIEEWKQIVSICSAKGHVVFFDSAYQGFASGDPEADAQPFRYAVAQHIPILLAQSFAKNFGLYGERCGTLSVVCGDAAQKVRIMSELRCLIRPMYSSPPRHGSSIVKTILGDEALKVQYMQECDKMAQRIASMRSALVQTLEEAGSTHDWSHVTQQIGMFAFLGLTAPQCERMTEEFAIYLTTNGRISVAGLNPGNVAYVAKAIHAVSDGQPLGGELRTGGA